MTTWLWLDVATTGFHPKANRILEIACMLTTPKLEIIETFAAVVQWDGAGDVPDFHVTNGLADAAVGPGALPLRKLEGRLLAGAWSRAERLVNRHPAFDRAFLAEHMPTFAAGLPRASLNVDEVEAFVVETCGGAPAPKPVRTYRAEDDLVEAYEALAYYRSAR